jgi:hypothetical protein
MKTGYKSKQIPHVLNAKFLEIIIDNELSIIIDNSLSWKLHIQENVPELRAAFYAIRSFKLYISNGTIKMVHYCYFHSIKIYGLISWENY